jgi:hypothetical protein
LLRQALPHLAGQSGLAKLTVPDEKRGVHAQAGFPRLLGLLGPVQKRLRPLDVRPAEELDHGRVARLGHRDLPVSHVRHDGIRVPLARFDINLGTRPTAIGSSSTSSFRMGVVCRLGRSSDWRSYVQASIGQAAAQVEQIVQSLRLQVRCVVIKSSTITLVLGLLLNLVGRTIIIAIRRRQGQVEQIHCSDKVVASAAHLDRPPRLQGAGVHPLLSLLNGPFLLLVRTYGFAALAAIILGVVLAISEG